MKLAFATKAEAQARADSIHTALIADSPLYAVSVALYTRSGGKAGTARWAIPFQVLDRNDNPIGTDWYVTVDERPRRILTKTEVDTFSEWKVEETAA